MEMLRTVAKAWNIPDLRKKIIFTVRADPGPGYGQRCPFPDL